MVVPKGIQLTIQTGNFSSVTDTISNLANQGDNPSPTPPQSHIHHAVFVMVVVARQK